MTKTIKIFQIARLVMNKWLENFAYRTNMSWWMFALAAFASLFVAFFTISFSSHQSSDSKSSKEFENGIVNLKICRFENLK